MEKALNNLGISNEPFLFIPLRLFDQGLSSAVSFGAFHVYLHIRRFVWRNGKTLFGKKFYLNRILATKIKQAVLAQRLSMSERHVRSLIAELRKAGWLKTSNYRTKRVYVLGEWFQVNGCYVETYLIDSLFQKNKVPVAGDVKVNRIYSSGSTGNIDPVQRRAKHGESEALLEYPDRRKVPVIDKSNKKNTKRLKEKLEPCRVKPSAVRAHGMRTTKPSVVPSAWGPRDDKRTLVSKKVKTNAHSLAKEYRALLHSVFASPPSPLSGRELAHLASLAKQLGPKASSFLRFAVENWNVVRVKIGAKDILPTVKTIFAFREQIIFLTSSKDMGTTDTTKTDEEEGW